MLFWPFTVIFKRVYLCLARLDVLTPFLLASYLHIAPGENPEYLSHFGKWDNIFSWVDKHPKETLYLLILLFYNTWSSQNSNKAVFILEYSYIWLETCYLLWRTIILFSVVWFLDYGALTLRLYYTVQICIFYNCMLKP